MNEISCRICFESGPRCEFIAPCACRGTSKWVHRSCLDKWRTTKEDRAFSKCTECLTNYILVSRVQESIQTRCKRRMSFLCYVFIDFGIALLVVAILIFILSYIVFMSDFHSKSLITSFHAQNYPRLFYFLFGTSIFFAVSGIVFLLMILGGDEYCCQSVDCRWCYFNDPSMFQPTCCCCHQDLCVGCDLCPCSFPSPSSCGPLCICEGESALGLAVLLFLVLVIFGFIVVLLAGVYFSQVVLSRHWSVLEKKTLASDILVKDLEEDDVPLSFEANQSFRSSSQGQAETLPLLNYQPPLPFPPSVLSESSIEHRSRPTSTSTTTSTSNTEDSLHQDIEMTNRKDIRSEGRQTFPLSRDLEHELERRGLI